MELVLLFALSVIVAIFYNWGAPRFMASQFGARFSGNYAMSTLGTALVFFAAIWLTAIVLARAGKEPALTSLPLA